MKRKQAAKVTKENMNTANTTNTAGHAAHAAGCTTAVANNIVDVVPEIVETPVDLVGAGADLPNGSASVDIPPPASVGTYGCYSCYTILSYIS